MKKIRISSLLALASLSMLLFDGCGKVRYPTSYVLEFPRPPIQPAVSRNSPGTIFVREFGCLEYLCRDRIVYRPSPEEVGFYEYHRWAMDPRRSVTQFVADTLALRSGYNVRSLGSAGGADYILAGEIEHLEEVDRGSEVFVECAISGALVDVRTHSIVWRDRAAKTLAVDRRDMRGVVSSLTAAAQMVVDQLVTSAVKALPPVPVQ